MQPGMRELDTAGIAARAGGEVLSRYFQTGVIADHKNDVETYNLVSVADVEAEQAIVEVIRRQFPNHAVLGEESHHDDAKSEHLWVVDPLDGTTNFVHGIPHYAVSIAYYHQGKPKCGVIFNPSRDDWYEATAGGGAFHNGKRVSVCSSETLDKVLVSVGFYYDRGEMMEATLAAVRELFHAQIHGIRRFGTAALDLAQVGCGLFGAYFEYQLSPWDFAAGVLFVEEAGGRVTTSLGEPLPLRKTDVLATNRVLHEQVQRIVGPHLPASMR
ncbi:MAG TPA: inositol monophosphatase family protein [Pirellulaceae bacterium]|nr:inositol monophosphatase [Planctomycetales bacterium]MCB9937166.1 inositol monophosphatase [Planctomycetaceae bacterium]HRX83069.1 inositol monophosphatase family protein [Pirellulaceae bacterium]